MAQVLTSGRNWRRRSRSCPLAVVAVPAEAEECHCCPGLSGRPAAAAAVSGNRSAVAAGTLLAVAVGSPSVVVVGSLSVVAVESQAVAVAGSLSAGGTAAVVVVPGSRWLGAVVLLAADIQYTAAAIHLAQTQAAAAVARRKAMAGLESSAGHTVAGPGGRYWHRPGRSWSRRTWSKEQALERYTNASVTGVRAGRLPELSTLPSRLELASLRLGLRNARAAPAGPYLCTRRAAEHFATASFDATRLDITPYRKVTAWVPSARDAYKSTNSTTGSSILNLHCLTARRTA